MIALLGFGLSSFALGVSVASLVWSVWYRRANWPQRAAAAYERGQVEGYRAREVGELYEAVEQARLVGLQTEVPRWEQQR